MYICFYNFHFNEVIYSFRILIVFTKINKWPYAFMYHLNPVAFILFMFGCTIFSGCIYAIGRILASFRWRGKTEMGKGRDIFILCVYIF